MFGLQFILFLLEGGFDLFGRNKTMKSDLVGDVGSSQFSGNE